MSWGIFKTDEILMLPNFFVEIQGNCWVGYIGEHMGAALPTFVHGTIFLTLFQYSSISCCLKDSPFQTSSLNGTLSTHQLVCQGTHHTLLGFLTSLFKGACSVLTDVIIGPPYCHRLWVSNETMAGDRWIFKSWNWFEREMPPLLYSFFVPWSCLLKQYKARLPHLPE